MADEVKPLLDVRELQSFQLDQEAIHKALAAALPFTKEGTFKNRDEAGAASDAIKALRQARTDAEKQKLTTTAEWRASTDHVNGNYNELLNPVKAAEDALKRKGLAWKKEEEAKERERVRQEEEKRQKEAEAKAQEALEAAELAAEEADNPEAQELADETRQEAAAAAVAAAPSAPREAPKAVRGAFSSLHGRTDWRFEVTAPAEVPDIYKTIDPTSVKAAIDIEVAAAKAERREVNVDLIPGVRVFPHESGVSR